MMNGVAFEGIEFGVMRVMTIFLCSQNSFGTVQSHGCIGIAVDVGAYTTFDNHAAIILCYTLFFGDCFDFLRA